VESKVSLGLVFGVLGVWECECVFFLRGGVAHGVGVSFENFIGFVLPEIHLAEFIEFWEVVVVRSGVERPRPRFKFFDVFGIFGLLCITLFKIIQSPISLQIGVHRTLILRFSCAVIGYL
jgi:hypothetical protein